MDWLKLMVTDQNILVVDEQEAEELLSEIHEAVTAAPSTGVRDKSQDQEGDEDEG